LANGSVIRSQPTLKRGITSGNCGEFLMGRRRWNALRFKGARIGAPPLQDGTAADYGSWRGKGPPSRLSVRAMRVAARRRVLRQGPEPYGVQQARNFRNARKRDGGNPSDSLTTIF